jgi:hypothetical protein
VLVCACLQLGLVGFAAADESVDALFSTGNLVSEIAMMVILRHLMRISLLLKVLRLVANITLVLAPLQSGTAQIV